MRWFTCLQYRKLSGRGEKPQFRLLRGSGWNALQIPCTPDPCGRHTISRGFMLNRKMRRSRGFSLIELLIVIAIILVILTIAVPKYQKSQMFAREVAALTAI